MSYKNQRLLDILPDEVEALETLAEQRETQLGNQSVHGNDVEHITDLAKKLESARNDIDIKQDQWLLLEEQRELLEQAGS